MQKENLAAELEKRVEQLGFELVELDQAGTPQRPLLRLRIDRPDSAPGSAVTLEDCTTVSRALESYLDDHPQVAERYVLEVSSPGVERPLVRPRDFERFQGKDVVLKGKAPLAGRGRKLAGVLLGLVGAEGEEGGERVRVRLAGGEEVEVPRSEISRAHLVYRWGAEKGES